MNIQLCDFENQILTTIWSGLDKPTDCVLCFDGIMVKEDTFDLHILEAHVMQTLNITIKLVIKPMNQGFELNNIDLYVEPIPISSFDFDDTYNYHMFRNDYKERQFSSWDAAHTAFNEVYTRVIGLILRGEGSYIKKLSNGHVDVVKRLGSSDFNIYVGGLKSKFSEYIFKQPGFNNYVCKLDTHNPTDFNLWTGFQAKRTDETPPSLELMKRFILETWAYGNVEYYNYIISWIAGLFTNLSSINKIALVMISKPGTGKGFLLEFIKLMLRSINCCEVAGIQAITQKHNSILQNKRLVSINEMSSTKDEFRSNFDKIKMYITDPVISIEPKGVNAYQVDNISNFMLFTNHPDAVIIEESDRRYAVFEVSDCHRNDTEYFNNLHDNCFNQETADSFYTYLLDYPAVDIKQIPDTELRRGLIQLSKSTPIKFTDAIVEEELYEEDEEVNGGDLYNRYTAWCDTNGERNKYSNTKFGTTIKGVFEKRRSKQGMVYIIK